MKPTRREVLAGVAAAAAHAAFSHAETFSFQRTSHFGVNGDRLRQHIEGLSVYGRPAGGTFADGVSRTAYSEADVAGHKYVLGLIRDAGLDPHVDPAGNIRALRQGSESSLKPILFGSHIDSVKQGGNFDGDVGTLGAIEVLQTLKEHNVVTRHPLDLVVWEAEESNYGSGLSGSRAAAGALDPGEYDRVDNGVTKRDAVRKVGGDADRIAEARLQRGSFTAYLELHIEQGGTLDTVGIPIGIVEGIVGIEDYEVTVRGFANHAGTTPMPQRKDALVAASMLVLAINEIANSIPGRQVATVGQISVSPGASNVIPGIAKLSLDVRDLDAKKIAAVVDEIKRRAIDINVKTGCSIEFTHTGTHEPARTSPEIQQAIARAAGALNLKHTILPSGAGHDAQMMAKLGPIGMIFVPSVAGISHSPRELSRWQDCTNGANVLMETILELDKT